VLEPVTNKVVWYIIILKRSFKYLRPPEIIAHFWSASNCAQTWHQSFLVFFTCTKGCQPGYDFIYST